MTANDTIKRIMKRTNVSLSDLTSRVDMGTKSNVSQLLSRKDMKVGTFVKLLDALDCQLVVESLNDSEDYIVDNEED